MKKLLLLLAIFVFATMQGQTTQGGVAVPVAISEIMYNPPESGTDSLEFIEIHNYGLTSVNLNGWKFTKGILYTFPNYIMPAGSYLVLCADSEAFANFYGFAASKYTQALNNTPGDSIELRDGGNNIIDFVAYTNAAPWPNSATDATNPAGGGPSIQFCDFLLDNSDGANWAVSTIAVGSPVNAKQVYATPGAGCTGSGVGIIETAEQNGAKIYPNPVNNELSILINGNKQYTMQVYDVTGKLVMANTAVTGNNVYNVDGLTTGLYVARFNQTNSNKTFAVKFLKK